MSGVFERRPWAAYAAFLCLVSAVYGLAAYAPWMPPLVVPPLPLDARIPFAPWAAWPYASYLLLLPLLVAVSGRWQGFTGVAVTGMSCALANAAIFAALPTRLASRPDASPGTLLALLQSVDPPACAIPSGHVALPVSLGLAALFAAAATERGTARRWRVLGALYLAWASVLGASALLTKQHFAIDIAAGVAFGVLFGLASRAVRSRTVHGPTLAAACFEWVLIVAVCAAAARWWSWASALVAIAVVATRQHALLALFHDGVHGHVARGQRLNDFLVNGFAGVPMLLPVHAYRALHLAHHQHLGSERDPERSLLYRDQPWRYRPLPTARLARQLAGDLLLWNGVRMLWRYARDRELRARLPATRWYPELALQLALFASAWLGAAAAAPGATLRLAVLWFVPYLTLAQLLNKLRSFGEHASREGPGEEGEQGELSCSWAPGLLGRATVWPYNISRHREHHRRPELRWDELPRRVEALGDRPGRELLPRIWRGAAP